MNIRSTTAVSIFILLLILGLALAYGLVAYKSMPDESAYNNDPDFIFPYDMTKPAADYDLPVELEEISGLTWYKDNQILAIQDEQGILYVFDLQQGKVVQKFKHGDDLDYEGVALASGRIFVLERDGDLYQIDGLSENNITSVKFETMLDHRHETEGICHDEKNNRLLVALKEHVDQDKEYKDKRAIFAFDLGTMRMTGEPVILIDEVEVGKIVYGEEKKYHFKPSAIDIHPSTGDIYVLASVGKVLIVLDPEGKIRHIQLLDPTEYRQPEGLAFDGTGKMIISSEARGAVAKIKVFDPNQNF